MGQQFHIVDFNTDIGTIVDGLLKVQVWGACGGGTHCGVGGYTEYLMDVGGLEGLTGGQTQLLLGVGSAGSVGGLSGGSNNDGSGAGGASTILGDSALYLGNGGGGGRSSVYYDAYAVSYAGGGGGDGYNNTDGTGATRGGNGGISNATGIYYVVGENATFTTENGLGGNNTNTPNGAATGGFNGTSQSGGIGAVGYMDSNAFAWLATGGGGGAGGITDHDNSITYNTYAGGGGGGRIADGSSENSGNDMSGGGGGGGASSINKVLATGNYLRQLSFDRNTPSAKASYNNTCDGFVRLSWHIANVPVTVINDQQNLPDFYYSNYPLNPINPPTVGGVYVIKSLTPDNGLGVVNIELRFCRDNGGSDSNIYNTSACVSFNIPTPLLDQAIYNFRVDGQIPAAVTSTLSVDQIVFFTDSPGLSVSSLERYFDCTANTAGAPTIIPGLSLSGL